MTEINCTRNVKRASGAAVASDARYVKGMAVPTYSATAAKPKEAVKPTKKVAEAVAVVV